MAVEESSGRQLRELGARFRRIATSAEAGERELEAACAWGGKLLTQASEARLLLFDLPRPAAQDSGDDASEWAAQWVGGVQVFAAIVPDQFPTNPSDLETHDGYCCLGDQTSWRIRAENYAATCDVVADQIVAELAARASRLNGIPKEKEPLPAIKVDTKLLQVRCGNEVYNVTDAQATGLTALVDADGEWVSWSGLGISNPAREKKSLPQPILELIESSSGKGYRLKRPKT